MTGCGSIIIKLYFALGDIDDQVIKRQGGIAPDGCVADASKQHGAAVGRKTAVADQRGIVQNEAWGACYDPLCAGADEQLLCLRPEGQEGAGGG